MQSQSDSIVSLGYASYRGRHVASHIVYLGVPYAEPPLGPLRFRKPVPLDTQRLSRLSPTNVFDATQYPAFSVQGAIKGGGVDVGGAGSEDSLKVDIYCSAAQLAPGSNLPVLVYIHGGGYKYGAPKNWPFDHWVERHPNIIAVSVYYRLSVLGFLAHPDFSGSDIADNNCGLYDQLEALRWIKTNISKFGGDPGKITICGQSAGGSAVELLLTAFSGKNQDLFHAAIPQSVYRTPVFKAEEKKPAFDELSKHLGCQSKDLAEQVAWLRSVNAVELMQAADSITDKHKTMLWEWKPVVDGDLISDYPSKLIVNKSFVDVPLLVGATTDESVGDPVSLQAVFATQFPAVRQSDLRDAAELYGGEDGEPTKRAVGDVVFRAAGALMAERFSTAWLYRFNEAVSPDGLVGHSADNYLLYQGTQTGPNATVTFNKLTAPQQALSDELMDYIVSFVRSGSPNTYKQERSPDWPSYSKSGELPRPRMVLGPSNGNVEGSACRLEGVPDDERDRYIFWLKKVEQTQN
ncbi:hypothetical protein FRB95_006651 [Tulasnella sp. JGI-2019a]|nr:hypothetical protein FRB95_006651 [Tulasnella sp. JGI-2019a]